MQEEEDTNLDLEEYCVGNRLRLSYHSEILQKTDPELHKRMQCVFENQCSDIREITNVFSGVHQFKRETVVGGQEVQHVAKPVVAEFKPEIFFKETNRKLVTSTFKDWHDRYIFDKDRATFDVVIRIEEYNKLDGVVHDWWELNGAYIQGFTGLKITNSVCKLHTNIVKAQLGCVVLTSKY